MKDRTLAQCLAQYASHYGPKLLVDCLFNPKPGCIPQEEFEVIRRFEAQIYRSALHEYCHPDIAGVVVQYLLETSSELLCQLFNVVGDIDHTPNIKDFDSTGLQLRLFSPHGTRLVTIVGWENISRVIDQENQLQDEMTHDPDLLTHRKPEAQLYWWQIWCRDEREDHFSWQESSDSLRCENIFWCNGEFVHVPVQVANIDLLDLTDTYFEQDGSDEDLKQGVLDYLHETVYPTADDSTVLFCDRWRIHEILCANII